MSKSNNNYTLLNDQVRWAWQNQQNWAEQRNRKRLVDCECEPNFTTTTPLLDGEFVCGSMVKARKKSRHRLPIQLIFRLLLCLIASTFGVSASVVVCMRTMKLKELNAHRMDLNKPERLSWIFYLAFCKSCLKHTQTHTHTTKTSTMSTDFQVYRNKMCQIACGNFSVWDKLLFLQVEKRNNAGRKKNSKNMCACAEFRCKNLSALKAKRSAVQSHGASVKCSKTFKLNAMSSTTTTATTTTPMPVYVCNVYGQVNRIQCIHLTACTAHIAAAIAATHNYRLSEWIVTV